MRKAVERETNGKEKSRKSAETKKTAGKRSSTKPALRRAFDPDALINSMDGMVYVASSDYRLERGSARDDPFFPTSCTSSTCPTAAPRPSDPLLLPKVHEHRQRNDQDHTPEH